MIGQASSRVNAAALPFLAVNILAWGGNYALTKLALEDSAPFTFNALRFFGAALVLGCILAVTRKPLLPERGEGRMLAVVGVLQVSVMLGLSTWGLQYIDASRAVLIAYSMPIWALLLERLLLHQALTGRAIIGTVGGVGGLAFVFSPTLGRPNDSAVLLGSVVALLGTIGWAAGSALYRRRAVRTIFWTQVFWQMAIGSLPLIVLAVILEHDRSLEFTTQLVVLLLYNILVPVCLGYWTWSRALSLVSATTAGQLMLLAPVFGILLAYAIFRDPLTVKLFGGTLLILLSAWVALRPPTGPKASGS